MAKSVCTVCGWEGKPGLVTQGSFLVEVILWCFLLVPGILYSLWRVSSRQKACPSCGSPAIIPTTSPKGREILAARQAALPPIRGFQGGSAPPVPPTTAPVPPRLPPTTAPAGTPWHLYVIATLAVLGSLAGCVVLVVKLANGGDKPPAPAPAQQQAAPAPSANPR